MFTADTHCDTLYSIAINGLPFESCAVTPERMKAGCVGLQTFAMFTGAKGPAGTPYEDGRRMLAAAKALSVPIFAKDLPDCPPDFPAGVLAVEGGEVFEGRLDRVAEFDDDMRIRLVALTWNH